jgi:hypothetical protein
MPGRSVRWNGLSPLYPVILPESELRARAERLKRDGRMPSREDIEAVLTDILGPKKDDKHNS